MTLEQELKRYLKREKKATKLMIQELGVLGHKHHVMNGYEWALDNVLTFLEDLKKAGK